MTTNHISSSHSHSGGSTDKPMPDTRQIKGLRRVKDVLRDPLTFVLLVWTVMIVVAGVYCILSQ